MPVLRSTRERARNTMCRKVMATVCILVLSFCISTRVIADDKSPDFDKLLDNILTVLGLDKKDVAFYSTIVGGTKTILVALHHAQDNISKRKDELRTYRRLGFNESQFMTLQERDVVEFSARDIEELTKINALVRKGTEEPVYFRFTDADGKITQFEGKVRFKNDGRVTLEAKEDNAVRLPRTPGNTAEVAAQRALNRPIQVGTAEVRLADSSEIVRTVERNGKILSKIRKGILPFVVTLVAGRLLEPHVAELINSPPNKPPDGCAEPECALSGYSPNSPEQSVTMVAPQSKGIAAPTAMLGIRGENQISYIKGSAGKLLNIR